MRLVVLFSYQDLSLSSYSVMTERDNMEHPINFNDTNVRFYFGFADRHSFAPAVLDPRIGEFSLKKVFDNIVGLEAKYADIAIEEVDLENESKHRSLLKLFGDS